MVRLKLRVDVLIKRGTHIYLFFHILKFAKKKRCLLAEIFSAVLDLKNKNIIILVAKNISIVEFLYRK